MEATGESSPAGGSIYLEKQRWLLCALHTLNNLLQDAQAFSKSDLDGICESLASTTTAGCRCFGNPHRSLLGLGDYDVNVLMYALQQKGLAAIWFDRRKSLDTLQFSNIFGFILNRPVQGLKLSRFLMPWRKSLHWLALRQIDGIYYNLDSDLQSPLIVGNDDDMKSYMQTQLENDDRHLLIVVTSQVEALNSWLGCEQDK